ncbi:hypothetical protein ACFP4H_00525 [Pseudophaeobacter arcticus]|uniref:hypothetical protein n=1 Tax=Pseudophaeobacter arcticus TaxID=385492 RepID=UPI0004214AA8|nr:hypothetical protein [Pseudophaeobacter arcticus]
MKPEFALSLSAEGIVLLHRAAGGWRNVGSVPLDSADLTTDLAALKAKGDALAPKGLCKLIIPSDQIRYLTIETGISDLESRRRLARAALEGATPYPVSDLAFDLSEDGDQTHIAAVAYETLAEAESFALENGFSPASFVATPGESGFLGEPFFGTAPSLGEAEVTPDGIAVVDIGPAAAPNPEPTPAEPADKPTPISDAPQPADGQAPAVRTLPKAPAALEPGSAQLPPDEDAENSGPIAGFSSRRKKSPEATRPESVKAASAKKPSEKSAPPPPGKPAPTVAGVSTVTSATPLAATLASPLASTLAKPVQSPSATAHTTAAGVKSAGHAKPLETGATSPAVPGPRVPVGANTAASLGSASLGSAPGKSSKSAAPASAAIAPTSVHPKAPTVSGSAAQAASSLSSGHDDKPDTTKGKPRFLGLFLTAGLLLAMAAIAAFALFSEGGLFFSAERPPLEQSNEPPLATSPAGTADQAPAIGAEPPAAPGTEATRPADIPISEIETEPDSIAPQVSAIPGQSDPGVVELSNQAEPLETARLDPASLDPASLDPAHSETDTQLETSTGQPVLDALEGDVHDLDPDDALSEAALYAATGIWQQVPQIADAPALVSLDDIYIASIDNSDLSQDAVALPGSPQLSSDPAPDAPSSPAAAGSDFDLDHRGMVTATPEGTLNPDGIMVYLGRPRVTPPPTPARAAPEDTSAEDENARLASLSRKRPRLRPSDLLEQAERALLGGLSRAELSRVRPRARPASLKTEEQENQPVSALAIASSAKPRARPANFANLVDRATRQRASTATSSTAAASAVTPRSVTPSIPSSASVARQATVTNAINLRRVNLIGVSGKPSNRQALVLLPSGRTRQVRVGDRLDGGTVVAISDSQLQYQKRGTNTTLKLPGN